MTFYTQKKVTKKSKIHKPPPWEIIAQWLICNWLCWNKKKWEIAYFVRSFDLCEKRFSKTGGEAIVFNRLIRLLKSDFMLMASIFIITFLIICKRIIIPNQACHFHTKNSHFAHFSQFTVTIIIMNTT